MEYTEPEIRVVTTAALGPFSWRWPEGTECFDRGWAAVAVVDGQEVRTRHGIGRRDTYGRSRVHSVTWVNGEPLVEGVGADDFDTSGCLLSLIKVSKRHLKPSDAIPPGYASLPVVVMAEEAVGPYSPRSLAVKLRQDDMAGWTRHALLRAMAWGRLRRRRQDRVSLPHVAGTGPAPAAEQTDDGGFRDVIVAALLAFAERQAAAPPGPATDFTSSQEANELVRTDPFAFLTAVLFDQGVPAERAWLAPMMLHQRLGHLDPARIAVEESAVRDAIQADPKLHRYIEKMPRWLVLAARRVMSQYGGDAGAIWAGRPSADGLQRRFDAFDGIGQKKAAMAVEILARDLDVDIGNLERSDIAYDVHVRRVFLRTRLADRDDPGHMIAAARRLYPARPGALDHPTWQIGKGWCHPGIPDCLTCPLTRVCPKDIERAAHVTSG